MDKKIESIPQVKHFLQDVYKLLETEDSWEINSGPWANGKVNKTRAYMAETGIGADVIRDVVKELRVNHYSSTEDDYNPNFENEQVWKFGITKNLIDQEEHIYIKLKVRHFTEDEFLLIMSFHPESPKDSQNKLKFPYADYAD